MQGDHSANIRGGPLVSPTLLTTARQPSACVCCCLFPLPCRLSTLHGSAQLFGSGLVDVQRPLDHFTTRPMMNNSSHPQLLRRLLPNNYVWLSPQDLPQSWRLQHMACPSCFHQRNLFASAGDMLKPFGSSQLQPPLSHLPHTVH